MVYQAFIVSEDPVYAQAYSQSLAGLSRRDEWKRSMVETVGLERIHSGPQVSILSIIVELREYPT